MDRQIGFIGLGIMGTPMALNLLKHGVSLNVWARRDTAIDRLVDAGANACDLPLRVAETSNIVFLIVTDTRDVEELVLGDNGLFGGLTPGNVVVDMSTISPEATRTIASRLQEHNIDMLDAPVSGGEQGAISGSLSIMVGGESKVFQRVLPLFRMMGTNIVHVGAQGAGQVAKACNQLLAAQTMAAVAEALLFASKAGVDPVKVRDALLGGFAASRILEVHGQRMLDNDFTPGFRAQLHQKDLYIVLESAKRLGLALPGTAHVTQLINGLVGSGQGDLDSSAVIQQLEKLCGLSHGNLD